MRALALLCASGCSSIFGLDMPSRLDAGVGDGPLVDAQLDAPIDAVPTCFSDDFNDNMFDPRWKVIVPSSPHVVREQNQRLEIVLAADVAASTGLGLDVINSELTMEIDFVTPPANGNTNTAFGIVLDLQNQVSFNYSNATLVTAIVDAGTAEQTSRAFDPNLHRQWQIEIGGTPRAASLSARSSGNWQLLLSKELNWDITNASAGVIVSTVNTGNPDPGIAVFDNFFYAFAGCAP